MEDLLSYLSGNATSTSWGWDHSDGTRSALSLNLGWDGMDLTDSGTPISSSDWDHSELSVNKGTLDGDLDFFSDLDTDTNVSVSITDGADSLESGSLTGLGLLLNREDAHDVIEEDFLKRSLVLVLEKDVDDLGFLDWDGSGVDLLNGFDLLAEHKSTQFGHWGPLISELSSWWASSGSTSASSATSVASSATSAESTTFSSATSSATSWLITSFWSSCSTFGGCWCIVHGCLF